MAVTGWQGLWTDVANTPSGYNFLVNKNPIRNRSKRLVNRKTYRVVSELFDSLIGAASGGAALATHKEIAGITPFGGGGGLRTISTVEDINRNTTAADITLLKELVFNVKTRPSPYVRDLSGNGGPAYS